MPVPATCPHCGTDHRLADELDGRTIRCKSCREPFRVGGERPADDRIDDDYDYENERPHRRPRRRSSGAPVGLIIGIVVGVGVLACGGIVFLSLLLPAIQKVRVAAARAQGQRQLPPNAVAPKPFRPNGVVPRYIIRPPRPLGAGGRPAEPAAGPDLVTLSNLRRAEGVAPDRPTFQFDYQFKGGPPAREGRTGPPLTYYLVVKSPAGISETTILRMDTGVQDTVSFALTPGHTLPAGAEVWIERRPLGQRDPGERVSNVVTVP
jgi:hypothetical protein